MRQLIDHLLLLLELKLEGFIGLLQLFELRFDGRLCVKRA